MEKKEKVLLAFSGGLDTSFCAMYLKEQGYEVHTAIANTGGFDKNELAAIADKAQRLGVASHKTLDVTKSYYDNCVKFMVFGNVLRNGTYPISVSSERTMQAIATINYAKEIGADAIAHGSTGAGNDQIRFDLTFQILAPEIKIITPTRDMELTRDYEINYLRERGFVADFTKLEYSINKGLWGTSIGGKETLKSNETLPDSAYPSQVTRHDESQMTIDFNKGEICAVNGKPFSDKIAAINEVNRLGSEYGIGRDMHIGDTIIGIKGRVAFEAAGAILIITPTRCSKSTPSPSGNNTGRTKSARGTECSCTRANTSSLSCATWRHTSPAANKTSRDASSSTSALKATRSWVSRPTSTSCAATSANTARLSRHGTPMMSRASPKSWATK